MFRLITILSFIVSVPLMAQQLPCDHPDRIPLEFKMPNIFTPNGDGINDLFRAEYNVNAFDRYEMYIYNRAGQLIFYADRPAQGWDGRTATGAVCPEGTYFYVVHYETPCESDKLSAVLELRR
jgi:gliding motility-associated-like protein